MMAVFQQSDLRTEILWEMQTGILAIVTVLIISSNMERQFKLLTPQYCFKILAKPRLTEMAVL